MANQRFGRGMNPVERALASLRELPDVDREAVARVVVAAARVRAQDAEPNEDDLLPAAIEPARSGRVVAVAAAAVILLVIGGGAVVWRASRPYPAASLPSPVATNSPSIPAISAASRPDATESMTIPTQFVYDGRARRVALVGDFNGWDEQATLLVREPGSSLWSVTVPLQRGRHVYAFIVDSTWTTDRRAPTSRDPDFGVEGSVVIVGRP